jgi:hypothetical protein
MAITTTINTEAIERFWSSCKRSVLAAFRKTTDSSAPAVVRRPAATTPPRQQTQQQTWAPPSDKRSWVTQETRWFAAIVIMVFLALIEVLSWVTSSWPLCMVASTYQTAGSGAGGQTCATFSEGVIRFVAFLWAHADPNAITAVAAIIIAIFTWTLWRSSEKSWSANQVAAEAAKRSADALMIAEQAHLLAVFGVSNIAHVLSDLAAYVPSADENAAPPKERVFVQYSLKNYGRTPAILKEISHELVHWNKLPEELKYFAVPAMPKELAIGAGGGTESLQCTLALPLTVEAATSIGRGDTFLWFYGHVVYEDAFGREREHRFLYRYRIGPGFQPYYFKDYNRST